MPVTLTYTSSGTPRVSPEQQEEVTIMKKADLKKWLLTQTQSQFSDQTNYEVTLLFIHLKTVSTKQLILTSTAGNSHPRLQVSGEAGLPVIFTQEKSHQLPFGELIQ